MEKRLCKSYIFCYFNCFEEKAHTRVWDCLLLCAKSSIKVPPHSKMNAVLASLCRMMHVQSLTLERCFHIHLLKGESLCSPFPNLSLPMGMICDITTIFQPIMVQYSTYISVMWKLEASSAHTCEWMASCIFKAEYFYTS